MSLITFFVRDSDGIRLSADVPQSRLGYRDLSERHRPVPVRIQAAPTTTGHALPAVPRRSWPRR